MKGGTLEFDIVANNDGINKALNETEKRITGFSKATVEGGKSIDAMFDATNENIRIQKQVVKELESEYAKLEKEIKKVAPGNGRYPLQQQANAVKAEIEAEKNALTQLEGAVKKNEAAHVSLRTQLRNCVQQLAEMEQAGLRGTDAYKKLQAETGRLTDALGDAQTQAKILAHDNAGLQGVISAVSGVAGVFSAAQGTIGLFAGENENLQKIMVKVQSLMAITIGLQQVANTLNKDSYFRIVTLTKAKNLFAAATTRSSAALVKFGLSAGAANIAAKALVGTLTLGLSVAIGVAVAAINRINAKREEAQRKLKEQIELESDARAEMIKTRFELETTMRSIKNFTGTKDEEKQKVEELNRKYGDSFGTYKTLADWYDTLSKKAEDYIQILFLQAKVQSLVSKALEADLKVQEVKATDADDVEGSMGWFAKFGLYTAQSESSGNFDASAAITEHNEEAKEAAVKAAEDIRDGYLKEAEKLQEEIQKLITEFNAGKVTATTTGTNNSKDPFITQLETRKAAHEAYNKWVKAGLGAEANVFFNDTIGDGDSYIQYLEKLKTETTLTKEQLAKVNSEIADVAIATQQTQLADFETELQNQLSGAQNIMQKLDILEQRRNALSGDGSDLDNAKSSAIDKQAEEVAKQAKEETDALLDQYNQYLEKRINKSVEFENQMALLRRRASKAETKEERDRIEGIVEMYEKLHELHIDSFEELDQINADSIYRLGTFDQKRLMIVQVYEKLIGAARLAGQEDVAKKLEGERDLEIMKETEQYKEFFGDISEISIKTLENTRRVLLKMMQEAYNAGKLTADQYKKLVDEINKQADSAYKGRGFEALFGNTKGGRFMNLMFGEGDFESKINSFNNIFSGAKGDMANMASTSGEVAGNAGEAAGAMQGAAGGAAGALAIVDAIIKAVYQTLRAVSDTLNVIAEYQDSIGNSDAADNLGDWADIINSVNETAMSGWENLKSGNVMGAISDTISMPFKLLTTLNKIHDKNIDKGILKHAESIKQLERSYIDLERAVDRALGSKKFDAQKALIDSLQKQTQEYAEMAEAERGKKKSDQNKVEEYEDAAADNARKIADIIAGMRDDIIGSAADIASELGNAFFEAMAAGENALDAFNKKAEDVVKNVIQKMLIQKLLEQPIGQIIDKYASSWVDENGNFAGYDAVINSAGAMGSELQGVGAGFAAAMDALPEDIKKYFTSDNADVTGSLSGAIKGASQESIDLLAGQTNAVRVNQIVSIDLLREQLVALTGIYDRVGTSNRFLEAIERNTAASNDDPLRAQGIRL